MKIRNGFVSNSSSSSFVLSGTFQQVMNNIISMAELTASDISDNSCVDGIHKLVADDDLIEAVRDSRLGIHLPSVNYETYIRIYQIEKKDHYKAYIETCNNTNWQEVLSGEYDKGDEGDEDYNEMYKANREIDRFFIYTENNNEIRTAEHYTHEGGKYVKCSNKKCNSNKKDHHMYTLYFDQRFQPRCTDCDSLIIGRLEKFPTKKKETEPNHIVPGLL